MAESLSQEQIAEFREAFNLFDNDKDGQVSRKDLEEAMKSLGMTPTRSEISQMIEDCDPSNKGTIDFPSFISVIAKKMKNSDREETLIEAFQVFDEANSGRIPTEVLREWLTNYGDKMTTKDVDKVFKEVDTDAGFPYKEFVKIMMGH